MSVLVIHPLTNEQDVFDSLVKKSFEPYQVISLYKLTQLPHTLNVAKVGNPVVIKTDDQEVYFGQVMYVWQLAKNCLTHIEVMILENFEFMEQVNRHKGED